MEHIIGKNWHGTLSLNLAGTELKALGKVQTNSWLLTISHRITLEIADDFTIEPDDLPLVGYGCNGWIFDSISNLLVEPPLPDIILKDETNIKKLISKASNNDFTLTINLLNTLFDNYLNNKIQYLQAVNSSCRD